MKTFLDHLNEVRLNKVGNAMRDTSGRAADFDAMLADMRKRSMARDSALAKSVKTELEKTGVEVRKIKDNAIMIGDSVIVMTSSAGNIEASIIGQENKPIYANSPSDAAKKIKSIVS